MIFWNLGPHVINMSATPTDLFEVDAFTIPASDASASPPAPVEAARPAAKAAIESPAKISRRKLFRRVLGTAAFAVASGAYGRDVEPFWVQSHDLPMPLRNLPASFEGFRICHLSDLHAGEEVPMSYLRRVVDGVKKAKPDLVLLTGDLVNHAQRWVNPICDLLGEIPSQAGIPLIVSLGNHDYDVTNAYSGMPTRVADALEARLARYKIPTLRNRAMSLDHPDGKLWFVGLEDLASGRFSPQVAFAGLDALKQPIIALSHNPDTALELDAYGPQWILAGHTHGGQVRIPGVGPILLNIQNAQFDQGQVALPNSTLYVSRGVGYLKQVRVFCRPEVPTFILHRAV